MTFKDLQKVIVSQKQQQLQPKLALDKHQRLRGKSFWYWDQLRHKERDKASKGDCFFNHVVGLPKKDGKEMPLFDYESDRLMQQQKLKKFHTLY